MTLELKTALVISGDQSGAKRALQDTAAGINAVQTAATQASAAVAQLADPQQLAKLSTRELETYLKANYADSGQRMDAKAQVYAQRRADMEALKATAETAEAAVDDIGVSIDAAGGKFTGFKTLALGALGGIAGALGVGLVETALGAATAAVGVLVKNINSSEPAIRSALENQAALIRDIKAAYAEANGAASSYGNNSLTILRYQQQQRMTELSSASASAQSDLLQGGFFQSNAIQAGQGPQGSPLTGVVTAFRNDLAKGKADIIAFRNDVSLLAQQLAADDPSRKYADAILADTERAAQVQEELQRARDLYQGLSGDAEAAATALGGSADKFKVAGDNAAAALPALREYAGLMAGIGGVSVPGPAITLGNDLGGGGGFAAGGFTGSGPADKVAGFVHGKEFVFDATATARIGVANLEAIRRGVAGYAGGGFVGTVGSTSSGAYSATAGLANDFQVLSGAVSDFVKQLWQTRDPLAALGSVIASVSQNFLSSAIGAVGNMAGNWVSSAISGAFGGGGAQLQLGYQAGVGHGGATIGASASQRLVPMSLFAGAPRHHAGTSSLKAGEVPFIGMAGEEIGWPADLARKYGGGPAVNNFYISTPSPRAFAESQASVGRSAGQMLARVSRYN